MSSIDKSVVIACQPRADSRFLDDYASVAIDVIRSTTTAVTAVAAGRRCFPVPSMDAALHLASELQRPVLAGELGGNMPYGFDMNNSPAEAARRTDVERPMILLSSAGTGLLASLTRSKAAYVACFRNYRRTIEHIAGQHQKIALLAAPTRGEFREEDQMCCAWIAEGLIAAGYRAEDDQTLRLVERWSGATPHAFAVSRSVAYLLRTGQKRDLDFILSHFDDLPAVFKMIGDEVRLADGADQVALQKRLAVRALMSAGKGGPSQPHPL